MSTNPTSIRNLFKRGEVWMICKAALSAQPDGLTTRELAAACLGARQFDEADVILPWAMVGVLVNVLRNRCGNARSGGSGRGCGIQRGGLREDC